MSIKLPNTLIKDFEQNGAVCIRSAFDLKWIALLKKGIEKNLKNPSPYAETLVDKKQSVFFNDYCNWQKIIEFKQFIYESSAKEIARQLMQSQRIGFYHEHVLIKDPQNQKITPWHHDLPYYPIEGHDICSIWLPLDPIPKECSLRFVKGSHLWQGLCVPRKFKTHLNYVFDEKAHAEYQTIPDIDEDHYDIVSWALAPGDCVIFHGKTIHGALGNSQKNCSRRVFSTRWVGDDAHFCLRPWEISPPITGGLKPGEPFKAACFPDLG